MWKESRVTIAYILIRTQLLVSLTHFSRQIITTFFYTFAVMLNYIYRRSGNLLLYLLISLLSVTISRLLLFFLNTYLFKGLGFGGFLNIAWKGLRFDLSALAIYQLPFVLLYFIPFPPKRTNFKKKILLILFSISNFILILLNAIDSVYFRFTLKRSTVDFFSFVTTGDDTIRLLPQFLIDYWYILAFVVLLSWAGIWLFLRIGHYELPQQNSFRSNVANGFALLFFAGLTVLAIRGGFQLKPIRTIQAAEAVGVENAPLVLNTPFTIMKTINKQSLDQKQYFKAEDVIEIYNPIVSFEAPVSDKLGKKNVVLIIMESFSKEYMGPPFGLEGKTPFLDSLASESLFFANAFANGKKSIEGIPAILAGIPSLMEDPYITSIYSNNTIQTLASILKTEGYYTSFFHGGKTGTMGFDAFSKLAGFQEYMGMEDFIGEDSYDGSWGIYDEHFFQFFAEQLGQTPKPFFATFFSLSSHHPFKIPSQYNEVYKDSDHPILNTVAYADMALKKFFVRAENEPWFDNTLFIITADHTGPALNPGYATQLGSFAVPLLFYSPADRALKGNVEEVVQHIDIFPTTLGYLGYDQPLFSFGRNLFSKDTLNHAFAINYLNHVYQYVEDEFLIHFNGEKVLGLYNYAQDSLLNNPLKEGEEIADRLKSMENKCKAIVQTYNQVLIQNKQSIQTYQSTKYEEN